MSNNSPRTSNQERKKNGLKEEEDKRMESLIREVKQEKRIIRIGEKKKGVCNNEVSR
jgi:hypothetical protein